MGSGITKQLLSRYRASLLAPMCTQILGAMIIAVMIMGSDSISHAIEASQRSAAVWGVLDFSMIFRGDTVYLSLLIVAVTMNLTMFQQMRDLALLRSLGATPSQIRNCLMRQAAIVAVPAAVIGFLLAIPAAAIWLAALKAHAGVPAMVPFSVAPTALITAIAVELGASVIGTFVAVFKTSKLPPATALIRAQSGTRPIGRIRIAAGGILVAGGVLLSAILSQIQPKQAADAGIFIILGECIGIGLLAPYILSKVINRLAKKRLNGLQRLAIEDLATITRSLAGALIPLVLAIAFATVKVASFTTPAHVGMSGGSGTSMFGEYALTIIFTAFAVVAALNSLITISMSRRKTLATIQLAGASRQTVSTIVWIQVFIFAALATVLGVAIALATLLPTIHGQFGVWLPYIPPVAVIAGLVLIVGTVAIGLVLPAKTLMRRRPVEVIADRG